VETLGAELTAIRTAVDAGNIPAAWAALAYPESQSRRGERVGFKDLLDHMWNSFVRLSNADYLSLYPFATIGSLETGMLLQGIFQQLDRDITAALPSFKASEEAADLVAAVDEAQKAVNEAQQALREARKEGGTKPLTQYAQEKKFVRPKPRQELIVPKKQSSPGQP